MKWQIFFHSHLVSFENSVISSSSSPSLALDYFIFSFTTFPNFIFRNLNPIFSTAVFRFYSRFLMSPYLTISSVRLFFSFFFSFFLFQNVSVFSTLRLFYAFFFVFFERQKIDNRDRKRVWIFILILFVCWLCSLHSFIKKHIRTRWNQTTFVNWTDPESRNLAGEKNRNN